QAPHAASFPAVAKKLKAAHGKSDPVELKEPMSLNVLGQVRGLADELNKLKPGELIPRVVESSQGYAVCRLAARTQSREPQLAEVRDRVAQALKVQTAREKMQGAAEKLRNAAAASSFDQAAAKALVKPNVVETELLDARAFALPGEGPAPALAEAVLALDKPGLTAVATEADGSRAFVALVTDRKPEELLTIEATTLESRRLAVPSPEEPPEEELKKFYEANKEEFRVPDQVQVEYLAAPAAELAKALPAPSEDEIRSEYQKSVDAGKAEYRDWALAPQLAFLPLEKARDRVRQNLLRARSLAEATKRVREALAALRAEGAKADFAAYAAKNPPLAAGKSDLFDREKKGLEPIGNAPDLAKQAFAAKKGDVAGPIEGADGACLIRLLEAKPSHVPPFDEIKLRVEMKWERKRDIARAVAAAARFHEKLAADFTKAPQKDRSEAFRKLVQADPVNIEVQQPLSVTLSRPIYPPDPRGRRSSLITGLGERPALLAVIFRQRPAHITPVVEDPERHACYVALLTQFIPPKDPTEFELFSTQYELTMAARTAAGASWQEYLNRQIERD
ncbi:MAG: hypothetical protein FJ291_33010, partial [Planctomycetes bacterium]|nr:hypothetical protein [Planctomycetota bacterium]